MGGSGGNFNGYKSINTTEKLLSSAKGAQTSQQEIEINEFLEELLKEYNNRDVDAIHKHLEEIQKTLLHEIEGLEKILFGGSLSKHTFIEGMSDIDALVILKKEDYKNVSPKDLKQAFYDMLHKRFPHTEINLGALAVTLKFKDYDIQLLPSIKENGKLRISNEDGTKWSSLINSATFTKKLTQMNKANDNKVVPVIKISKSLLSNLPEKYRMSGYHIESLAVEAFSNYNGRYTLYDMTKHFLDYSIKRVLHPFSDVTGQSGIIDDNLGIANSISRQNLSKYLIDIFQRFSGSTSVAKELFK